jgi:hypothetical protein
MEISMSYTDICPTLIALPRICIMGFMKNTKAPKHDSQSMNQVLNPHVSCEYQLVCHNIQSHGSETYIHLVVRVFAMYKTRKK